MQKGYQKYLNMQKTYYDESGKEWSIKNDQVVGSYDKHNSWPYWEKLLFRNINTKKMLSLEYGCGPGRNLIKFKNIFERIDGIDISKEVLNKAKLNLQSNFCYNENTKLIHGGGDNIPIPDNQYDFVFSTICLQHIACYDIRLNIFKEIYRVLKKDGYFSFQMGFGKRDIETSCDYYENAIHAEKTNGRFDVRIAKESYLKDDLTKIINFKNYTSNIVAPNSDIHEKWIFVMVQK